MILFIRKLDAQEVRNIILRDGQIDLAYLRSLGIEPKQRRQAGLNYCDHLWAEGAIDAADAGQDVYIGTGTSQTHILCADCAHVHEEVARDRSRAMLLSGISKMTGVSVPGLERIAEKNDGLLTADNVEPYSPIPRKLWRS